MNDIAVIVCVYKNDTLRQFIEMFESLENQTLNIFDIDGGSVDLSDITDATSIENIVLDGKAEINITKMIDKSKEDIAYYLMDTDKTIPQNIVDKLNELPYVFKVRIIK